MKIGFDAKRCFHNRTGLGNYSRQIIDMLAEVPTEFELHLYTPKLGDAYPNIPHNVSTHVPKGIWKGLLSSLWRTSRISSCAAKDHIDVYHGLSAELPVKLKEKGISSVVTIHDLIFERYPEFYKKIDRKIYHQKIYKAAHTADIVVAISEQTKEDLVNFYHVDPSKIEVIYQDCSSVFDSVFSKNTWDQITSKYQLPKKYILQVGTLESRKNVATTIEAMKQMPDVELVLVGRSTPYFQEIWNREDILPLHDRIHHIQVDNMKELAAIYQGADAFVYPSLFEGFGIPIIEALRSKTPVITNQSGVFPEAGGPDSIYIDPTNPDELAHAVFLLLENDELRNSIAKSGYNFAEKFRTAHLLTQWTSLYNRLKK